MRIVVAQVSSSTDPAENLDLVADAVGRAAEAGADLVVLPEATMASFATRSADVAEPLSGPFASRVRELAAAHDIVVAVGQFTPSAEPGRCRNTLLVTGRGVEASYDKLHLFDAYGFAESDHIEPGDAPVLVEIGGVGVGLAICYDVRFPELFKHYADAGAQVVLVPASWKAGEGKVDQWRALVTARALDATVFVVASGQAEPGASGREESSEAPLGVGHSLVVDPLGTVLAEAGDGPGHLVVDLDPEEVADARRTMPVLVNSRFRSALA